MKLIKKRWNVEFISRKEEGKRRTSGGDRGGRNDGRTDEGKEVEREKIKEGEMVMERLSGKKL